MARQVTSRRSPTCLIDVPASPGANTLILPLYVCGASIVTFLLHLLWESTMGRKLRVSYLKSKSLPSDARNAGFESHSSQSIAEHIERHGGNTIFAFRFARLMGCLVLLALSSAAFALSEEESEDTRTSWNSSPHAYLQSAMCGIYFYASVLAILSLSSVKWGQVAVRHLNALLVSNFAVYFYRDIFPLATFALAPADLWEGRLLWPKVITLFAVSGIIPLVIPRHYEPLDPKNPMPVPNPEQTASILSSVLYFFLDGIVTLAYRIPHLGFDQLPPLCDYDHAKVLKTRAFPHMDEFASGKKQHIFFGLMSVFRWEFFSMAVLLTISGLSNFISPLAINRLLNYLEDPTAESFMKPWFWILLLLLGPLIYALAFQWDMFVGTHMMAQVTAIVTQLVFEHSLRIRIKADTADKGDTSTKTSSEKASANLLGKINNLVTVDLGHINEARNILFLVVLVPIQVVGSVIFLHQVLGWSAFVGLGVMAALFPLPGYVAKLLSSELSLFFMCWALTSDEVSKSKHSKKQMRGFKRSLKANVLPLASTYTRLKNSLSSDERSSDDQVRTKQMFGWEKQMNEKIAEKREEELNWIWWRKVLYTASGTLKSHSFFFPSTAIMKQELSASKVFSSMAVFDLLRAQIWFTFYCVNMAVSGKVSLDRLNDFLNETERLDSFASNETTPDDYAASEQASDLIGFRDAIFSWSNNDEADGTATPSSRNYLLRIEGELLFKPGCINLVVGPTGAGKTSLLMALLGEMHMVPSSLSSWFNLPRDRGVSYAAQESWVTNDTIKNNILFNAPMDVARYKKVLYQCCLERDLGLFEAHDETEVGEKGLTLSGGQKARVTLARAIYSDSQIILLDDILAALDVHTAKWIIEKCLRGDLIKNRTVILVTHNVAMASKLASFVVSGSISEALVNDEILAAEVSKDEANLEMSEKQIDLPAPDEPKKADGKLIVAEEIEIGHVSRTAMDMFFKGMGGDHAVLWFVMLVIVLLLTALANRFETWYLGYWASQYGQGTSVPVFKYLGIYSGLLLADTILYCVSYVYFALGSFRASKIIHTRLVQSIFGTTFRWLDITPTSRIIARCTGDTDVLDDSLSESLWDLISTTLSQLMALVAIVLFTPLFFLPGALVGILGAWCGRIYMASQLSVKREMSNAKAPVLGHIGATLAGLASVRAYGAQKALIQISIDRINRLTRVSRTFANLNRWAAMRIDLLGALFEAASLAYYLVYFQSHRPANIGFSLVMALDFSSGILHWVRLFNQFEYLEIEQEPKANSSGKPPAYWPASGTINVENLSAKYSPEGPEVLHDISFNISSGERVGVVGRTGSGKSSLTLSLLRCIFTDGTVYYDGLATSSLNLDALRANITIIPQPELLAGSLRSNLDMLGQFDDATLNDALRAAGLSSLQEDMEDGKLTLDSEIAGGGNNLSVGQRQIIALARAIVRGSKLLILDEATSAIDHKTDAVIQTSLRTELPRDTTLLTVAHRLATIMDADKIMVLDAGRIVEFDSPKVLLENPHGMLRALVDESGDRGELYKMAKVQI
ncbi:P-loop containing nucleoside triphosphate hydrolase protein [Mycena crocata]|nr:P-loop containing nucleoside triphosphate hydrolase protein [Mycena crocata]